MLREKGYHGRRLGPVQMTTDTAARVTRMVIKDNCMSFFEEEHVSRSRREVRLDQISYIDFPEIQIDKHESTEMPFRYVKDQDGKPVMPKVGFQH